jgi:hypothetical protein
MKSNQHGDRVPATELKSTMKRIAFTGSLDQKTRR